MGVLAEMSDEQLPARSEDYDGIPAAVRIADTADAMEEVNRLLWQLAKSVFIIAAILFALFMVFAMYWLATAGMGVLG